MRVNLINPYIVGRPIDPKEQLFGQDDVFQFLKDNLVQGTPVILLHGQRRIGKSSVLAHIPERLRNLTQFVFISLSLEGQSQESLGGILHYLAKGITSSLKLSESQIIIPKKENLDKDPKTVIKDFFQQIFQVLGEKKPVLVLDEFDAVGDNREKKALENFFSILQFIVNDQKEKICLIPVVGRQLDDIPMVTSLFGSPPRKEIGLLAESHTKRLITQQAEGILDYQPKAVQAIWKLTSGQPYCTQLLCSVMFEKAREKQEDEEENWEKITEIDVEKNINEAIQRGENGLTWFRQGLPIAERVVFAAISEIQERSLPNPWKLLEDYGVRITDELDALAIERLKTGNFIEEREPSDISRDRPYFFAIKVEFVRRWFKRKYSLRQEILELEKLHTEVFPVYEKAVDLHRQGDLLQAITEYDSVLDVNPNHFSALSALASACLDDFRFSRAVELYTRVCKADLSLRHREALVKSLIGCGRDLVKEGMLEQARVQFQKAIELEPDNKQVWNRLLNVEVELEKERQKISASLQISHNPFFVSGQVPPEYFIGRKRGLRIAFDLMSKDYRGHLALYGISGIGKSSLLYLLTFPEVWQQRGKDYSKAFIVYLNCSEINPFTPSAFWREVLSLLREETEDNNELNACINEILKEDIIDKGDIRRILRKIGQQDQDKFLLLLIDEYDSAMHPNEEYTETEIRTFLSEFRNLAVDRKVRRNLCTIVTTFRRLNELGPPILPSSSPWYNHYLFQPLKPFNEKEIYELLGLMPTEVNLTQQLKQLIIEVCGGYPILLQNACYLIYQDWRSGKSFSIESFIENFIKATEHIYQDWWLLLNETEKILLMLISLSVSQDRLTQRKYDLSDLGMIFSQRERELVDLEDQGLIKNMELQGRRAYRFTSSIMEWWVLKEIESSDPEELAKREKVFLNLLSRQQVNKLLAVIQQIWGYKDASQSVISQLISQFSNFG